MMSKMTWLALAILTGAVASADTLVMKGGDRLTGKILLVKGDAVTFETAYAGTLTVKAAEIASMTSESGFYARMDAKSKDKEAVTLQHDAQGNVVLISDSDTTRKLTLSDTVSVWQKDATDPDYPPTKAWSYSAALGFNGRSGNTRSFAMNASVDATHSTENSSLRLYANAAYERTNSRLVTQTILGGVDYEYRPSDHHSMYLRDEATQNKEQGIKFRNTTAFGYGWYVWQNKKGDAIIDMLRLRLGAGYTYTKYEDDIPDHKGDATGDLGLMFRHVFECGAVWQTTITYQPVINDFDDYYIYHESKLEYFFDTWKISQEMGVVNEYVSEVSDGLESLDTYWFLRFKKSW